MALQVYSSQSRQKEVFTPIDPSWVKMYVCGPTVYNLVHIGNARPVVVFDTLFRLLQCLYPKVTYARNITDIDDKIMKVAFDEKVTISDVSSRYADEYKKDMAALYNLEPSITPFATDHLQEMIAMINALIEKGHAYAAEGHVLFAVQSMADYGKLSNRSLDDMLAGARVEVAPYKKYAGDFVLWKPSTGDEPGWESPWGYGRPGWHLECSAMIEKHLGTTIDIHGGGKDLIFPHHENEIAQSCCAHDGQPFVRYWMHNGFVNIDGEKMSKSLGNFRTVRELLESYDGEVIRLALLSAHYRSDMDFSKELLEQSKTNLDTFYAALRPLQDVQAEDVDITDSAFMQALQDDLNTPLALSELHALIKQLNKANAADKPALKGQVLAAARLLGLLNKSPDDWFKAGAAGAIDEDQIEALIAERNQARADKNWARCDEIRDQLKAEGVVLEDSKDGTRWRRE
ncbi:cysteine--tRNA ligase [Simiduia agarivorans]|uniref:Cysteine--tRNA ligase n=1 Tax=Simiduia agarivorans (strain DSM 21679 / JCM 13881 / BCRC 17597 / SA1) TaxID=1117647 RepID=K4KHA8_SIMAS|nr:cysteine--tRNA ligase [Simiduia agarivorans]AFU97333.1 cysteinyl-tRNA ligase [Simiduia agarivorans SA1 = DSM 21679]